MVQTYVYMKLSEYPSPPPNPLPPPRQKDFLKSKMDGQMDSHSEYSAYLRVVQNFDTKS